jgi:hypothetical protein
MKEFLKMSALRLLQLVFHQAFAASAMPSIRQKKIKNILKKLRILFMINMYIISLLSKY